jgi:hypothetical protein
MTESSYDSRKYYVCVPIFGSSTPEYFARVWSPGWKDAVISIYKPDSDDEYSWGDHIITRSAPGCGGPGAPAIPAGNGGADERAAKKKRGRAIVTALLRHVECEECKTGIRALATDDAIGAWEFVENHFDRPNSQLTEISRDADWTAIGMKQVGYTERTPRSLWALITRMGAEHVPVKNEVQKRGKFLSCITFPEGLRSDAEKQLQHFSLGNNAAMVDYFSELWANRFRSGEIKPQPAVGSGWVNPSNRVDARMVDLNLCGDAGYGSPFAETSTAMWFNTNSFNFCWNCWGDGHQFKSPDGKIICPSAQKRRALPEIIKALAKVVETGQGLPRPAGGKGGGKGHMRFVRRGGRGYQGRGGGGRGRGHAQANNLDEYYSDLVVHVDDAGFCYDSSTGHVMGQVGMEVANSLPIAPGDNFSDLPDSELERALIAQQASTQMLAPEEQQPIVQAGVASAIQPLVESDTTETASAASVPLAMPE